MGRLAETREAGAEKDGRMREEKRWSQQDDIDQERVVVCMASDDGQWTAPQELSRRRRGKKRIVGEMWCGLDGMGSIMYGRKRVNGWVNAMAGSRHETRSIRDERLKAPSKKVGRDGGRRRRRKKVED